MGKFRTTLDEYGTTPANGFKDPLAPQNQPRGKHRSRKDTRKWCKGKKGREHVPVVQEDFRLNFECRVLFRWRSGEEYWHCMHHKVCSVCGKILEPTLPREECPNG